MPETDIERRAIALTVPTFKDQNSFLPRMNVIASMLPITETPRSPFPSSGASVVSCVSVCRGGDENVPTYGVARFGRGARPAPAICAAPASTSRPQLTGATVPPSVPVEARTSSGMEASTIPAAPPPLAGRVPGLPLADPPPELPLADPPPEPLLVDAPPWPPPPLGAWDFPGLIQPAPKELASNNKNATFAALMVSVGRVAPAEQASEARGERRTFTTRTAQPTKIACCKKNCL